MSRISANSRISGAPVSIVGFLLATVLLGTTLAANATLRTIEQAYELTRAQVQLPGKADGNLTVRPCPDCRPVLLRVTPATAWFSRPGTRQPAGQAAVLAAFRASAANPGTLVYVYYEPQSRRVKRIVLDAPPAVTRR
ncbi:MAG: hypothetical protein ABL989_05290 [Gammaproteobacteria bacterium]